MLKKERTCKPISSTAVAVISLIFFIIAFTVTTSITLAYSIGYNNALKYVDDTSKDTLSTCPICKSIVTIYTTEDNKYYIKCDNCKLTTRKTDNKTNIVNYWNNR